MRVFFSGLFNIKWKAESARTTASREAETTLNGRLQSGLPFFCSNKPKSYPGGINLQSMDSAMALFHFALFGVVIVMILIIVKERKKRKK